jgi:hypothetical protein
MPKPEPTSKLLATVPKPPAKARGLSGAGTDSPENGPLLRVRVQRASDPLEEAGGISRCGPTENSHFHISRVLIEAIDGILWKRRSNF